MTMSSLYHTGLVVTVRSRRGVAVGCYVGATTPSPSREKAIAAVKLFQATPGHKRYLAWSTTTGGPPPAPGTAQPSLTLVDSFDTEDQVADWYGKTTDNPVITYATYFDTQAPVVEPVEEYAGTVTVTPDPTPAQPAAQARKPDGPPVAAIGVGLGVAILGVAAIAKHR